MEIPVTFTKFDEAMIREQQHFQTSLSFHHKNEEIVREILRKSEFAATQKTWTQTICVTVPLQTSHTEQPDFEVNVDCQRHLLVLKVETDSDRFQKLVHVPEHVNIHKVTVRFVPEHQVIIVRAPFMDNLEHEMHVQHQMHRLNVPVHFTNFQTEAIQKLHLENCFEPEQFAPGHIAEEKILRQLMKKQSMKKWYNTIQLEKEILERELTHRNFNIQVDPTKRIVIVKVHTPCKTIVICKKFVQVPENVNIHQLKVRVQPEQKIVLIKAPFFQTLDQQLAKNMTICEDLKTGHMFEEELCMERVMETEPALYKMCQAMRQHLPTFFVPRVIRHLESGLLKVVLDIVCDQEHVQIRPQDLLVKVHEIERCLAIKVLCEKWLNDTRRNQQVTPFFQPKQMCHEFLLPTFVNVPKVNWFQKSNKVIRIELPIIREQLRTHLTNTCFQNNEWKRCL